MSRFLRFAMVACLTLALCFALGCGKKQVSGVDGAGSAEAQAQAQAQAQAEAQAFQQAQQLVTGHVVYFAFDKFDLSAEGKELLKGKADALKAYPQLRVLIEGNCDTRGTQEYNLALGERRARAAYEYLVLLGARPEQLEIVSYGEERPAADGNNEAAWAQNRRAEFKLIR